MRKLITLFFLLTIFSQLSKAQEGFQFPVYLSDSAQISLLTNPPWDEAVYTLFGHASVRVKDPVQNLDLAFNFGVFSMKKNNFIFLFIKGETDYMVSAYFFNDYYLDYQEKGAGIIEQVLNLTQEEKQQLYEAFMYSIMPENREYRYNYFYDNCATRPRDILEKYIHGKINYVPTNKDQSYRDLVHECSKVRSWFEFGVDLVIGSEADKIITDRQKDFLPQYLMNAYQGATIEGDSISRQLVLSKSTLLEAAPLSKDIPVKPMHVGILLLIITIGISIYTYKTKEFNVAKIFDSILFLVAGIAGCIIFFLMFFSEHPCTYPNWNIVWLNPLQFIVAFLFFAKSLGKYLSYYHFINFVALLAFLLAWSLIPQYLEIAFIPFILSIAIRSGMNILQQKKLKKKADYSLPKAR